MVENMGKKPDFSANRRKLILGALSGVGTAAVAKEISIKDLKPNLTQFSNQDTQEFHREKIEQREKFVGLFVDSMNRKLSNVNSEIPWQEFTEEHAKAIHKLTDDYLNLYASWSGITVEMRLPELDGMALILATWNARERPNLDPRVYPFLCYILESTQNSAIQLAYGVISGQEQENTGQVEV